MRSIIVPVSDDKGLHSRVEAALDIARAASGHITFLYGTPVGQYVAVDPFGGAYALATELDAAAALAKDREAMLRERLDGEDIGWDFVDAAGFSEDVTVRHSRLADIVVDSAPPRTGHDADDAASHIAHLSMTASCPVFAIPPEAKSLDCAGKAVVAWNGSESAGRALRAAVPLLGFAESVQLVTIGAAPEQFPAEAAASYLSRHGIHPEIVERERHGRPETIMHDLLDQQQAAYLVMGAFGHSRMREAVFGGFTQHFVQNSPVPVLMMH